MRNKVRAAVCALFAVVLLMGNGCVPLPECLDDAEPGDPDCYGKAVSCLAKTYGGLNNAVEELRLEGIDTVQDLLEAIRAGCEATPTASAERAP